MFADDVFSPTDDVFADDVFSPTDDVFADDVFSPTDDVFADDATVQRLCRGLEGMKQLKTLR